MFNLPKTARGLAYLYLLMIVPLISIEFSMYFARERGAWLMAYDPWLFLGFILFALMYAVFWLVERSRKIFTEHLPFWTVTLVLLILLGLPVLAYFSGSSYPLARLFIKLPGLIRTGVLLVVAALVPYLAFSQNLSKKDKTVAILMALVYAAYHFIPVLMVQPVFRPMMALFRSLQHWMTTLVVLYFILAYIMHNGLIDTGGGSFFIVVSLGMIGTYLGVKTPVEYGSRGWFGTETYVNGVYSGSGVTQLFDINITVIVGVAILAFMFFVYVASRKEKVR